MRGLRVVNFKKLAKLGFERHQDGFWCYGDEFAVYDNGEFAFMQDSDIAWHLICRMIDERAMKIVEDKKDESKQRS